LRPCERTIRLRRGGHVNRWSRVGRHGHSASR
jgi:hypothetical protein